MQIRKTATHRERSANKQKKDARDVQAAGSPPAFRDSPISRRQGGVSPETRGASPQERQIRKTVSSWRPPCTQKRMRTKCMLLARRRPSETPREADGKPQHNSSQTDAAGTPALSAPQSKHYRRNEVRARRETTSPSAAARERAAQPSACTQAVQPPAEILT